MKALAVIACLLLAGLGLFLAAPAYSTLPDFTSSSNGPQMDHWDFSAFPVTWSLNPKIATCSGSPCITGSRSVAEVMQASFNTWTSAPNATLQVSRAQDTNVSSDTISPRSMNLICFVCTDGDFSKDSQTLAVTITTTADAVGMDNNHGGTATFAGQLIKADILFNPSTKFSTDGSSGQDLQTVATHEVGHFFGLDHSGVVRAVMFPAASSNQTLTWDDVAGISLMYPKSSPNVPTGAISGTVRFSSGGGVFGAHVYAESVTGKQAFGGNIRKSPIGTLSRPDGTYTITGVPPDSYIITAEPLDGPVSNSDISGYPKAFGQASVNTSFTTRWH